MLALLAAAPGPFAVGTEHVEVELQRLVVLVQVLDLGSLQGEDGRGLGDRELLLLAAGNDAAGDAALRALIGLGDQGDTDGLAALSRHLFRGQPYRGLLRDFQGPLVVAGEDQVRRRSGIGIQENGGFGQGDGRLVVVNLGFRFGLGNRIRFLAGEKKRQRGQGRPQEVFLHHSVMVMLNFKVAV